MMFYTHQYVRLHICLHNVGLLGYHCMLQHFLHDQHYNHQDYGHRINKNSTLIHYLIWKRNSITYGKVKIMKIAWNKHLKYRHLFTMNSCWLLSWSLFVSICITQRPFTQAFIDFNVTIWRIEITFFAA